MTYTVRMLYLNQGEPPPHQQLDGAFDSVEEAWEAGKAEALACQLRSVEAAYEIHVASGQIVEVMENQVEG